MKCSLPKLQADVMALLGEQPRRRDTLSGIEVPAVYDMLSLRIRGFLPECGGKLIAAAPACRLGGGELLEPEASARLMPCGLYAADMLLPSDTLRVVEIRLKEWLGSAFGAETPDSDGWRRQWSREAAVAGSPDMPRAYLHPSASGLTLRAVGTSDPAGAGASVSLWRVPSPDDFGDFLFPESLYPALVADIRASLTT